MKMTLTWYKGDDISHQQPITIRRKQMARKPRQWVAMKAWLEGASQNKNQDTLYWKMMHLYVGVPHQNLLNLIIQMKKLEVKKKFTSGLLTTKFPYQVHSYGAGTVMYHERAPPVLKPTYPKTTPHLGNVRVTNLYLPHTNVLSACAWKIPFDRCPRIYQMKPLTNKQTKKPLKWNES